MISSTPWGALSAFALVLIAVPAALWALRRFGVVPTLAGDVLRTVAMLPLAASQRVVVVELTRGQDRHWLVLGQSAGQVSLLTTLDAPPDSPTETLAAMQPQARTVAQLIERWRHGR